MFSLSKSCKRQLLKLFQYHKFSTSTDPLRVLVTGGSNGIGRSISQKFASQNNHVLSVDINETANKELQHEYPNIVCINKDITLAETPIESVEYMTKYFGGIDVLINNAAVQLGNGLALHELDESIWDRTLSVNLTSYFRFSKYVIQQILKQPKGNMHETRYNIINMASVQGLQSEKGVSSYCATKGAILSLTKNMAIEYAPLIRVNSISPGTILTPLVRNIYKEFDVKLSDVAKKYPGRRMGDPMEVANLVYFLCNSECGFLTGENITIDGGISKQGGWAAKSDNPYVDDEYLKIYED
eukprot:67871_1